MKKSSFILLVLIALVAFFIPDSKVSVVSEDLGVASQSDPNEYEEFKAPKAPTKLVATTFGDRALLLQWKDNSDREIAFDIHFVDANGKQGLRFVDPNVTRNVLGDLEPMTQYKIRVRARGPYGHSEFTPFVHIKTGGGKNFMVAFD